MSTSDDVHEQLRSLTERVSALEGRAASTTPVSAETTFWALDALREQRGTHPSLTEGVAMIAGSVTLPTGEPVEWQQAAASATTLDVPWGDSAAAFAALGNPVRLEILRHLLSGTRTTAALSTLDEVGTTGQLHHHLRPLISAGWVRQAARGVYEVPVARIVPLLACLLAAS